MLSASLSTSEVSEWSGDCEIGLQHYYLKGKHVVLHVIHSLLHLIQRHVHYWSYNQERLKSWSCQLFEANEQHW